MSFSCLNFSLHSTSYLATDNNSRRIGILDFRNVVGEGTKTKCCTMQLFVERKLSAAFKRAGAGSRRTRFSIGNRIKNELQPRVKCTDSRDSTTVGIPQTVGDVSLNKEEKVDLDDGNGGSSYSSGSSGNGKFPPGGGGGGGGGGGDGGGNRDGKKDDNGEEHEFGPLLKYDDIVKEVEARGTSLPADMLEAAKSTGIQKVLLDRYLDMQGSVWPLGAAMKSCSIFRNIMLADPSFLFKVGTEIIIDSCCATFAEVQKRGKDFWAEFELYAADLLVGVVVNVALVGMLAPYARIGKPSTSNGLLGKMAHAYGALPSSVFEAERPGCSFSVRQRIETYFYKGVLYGTVGFMCGLVGQGIANLIMTAKRTVKKSEEDVPVPPLIKSAALWGVFLAVSSNTRYQIINGMERLVEASPVARRIPPVAMAFTVGVRFSNNIYGGMQFVDWARLSGVQ